MPFKKGFSGNPGGKPQMDPVVRFNLKMAARGHCPEALDVIAKGMRDDDPRVRLMAANIILDRAYGKPKETVDVETVHRFAEVPQVMEKEAWLRTRGGMIADPLELKAIPAPEEPAKDDTPPKDRKLN